MLSALYYYLIFTTALWYRTIVLSGLQIKKMSLRGEGFSIFHRDIVLVNREVTF